MTGNIHEMLEDRLFRQNFAEVSDKADAPLAEALGLILRERVAGVSIPPSGNAIVNLWKKEIEEKAGRQISESEFASWLMYPKVFQDFAAVQETYGPVSVLPTPTYFYGMKTEDEIFVDIEKGKTLVIRCLGIGDTNDKGMVTVFFELNGQPRRVKVPDRAHGAAAGAVRRKAEASNESHVGAPMPGVVSTLAVSAGQAVKAASAAFPDDAATIDGAIRDFLAGS